MNSEEPTRFCLNCEYALDGLPENRCPECGEPFDPDDESTYRDPRAEPRLVHQAQQFAAGVLLPMATVVLLWCAVVIPPLFPVALLLAAVLLVRSVHQHRWAAFVVTALLGSLPIGGPFAFGIVQYANGTGRLWHEGPNARSHSLDPIYRCEWRT